jgi:uncharacterized membrane protein
MFRTWSATKIVVLAALTALITVLTFIKVPLVVTRGYVHLGDAGVYFAGFVFGPAIGGVAGGVGTMLADVLSGYAVFAPFTLVVHGLQGLAAGLIGYRKDVRRQLLGWGVGTIILVAGYFLAEWGPLQMGIGPALAETPFNLAQSAAGGLVAIPLAAAIRKAWPPIDTLVAPRTWEER